MSTPKLFFALILFGMNSAMCGTTDDPLLHEVVCGTIHRYKQKFGDIRTVYLSENNDFLWNQQNALTLLDELIKDKFFYPDIALYYKWVDENAPKSEINHIQMEKYSCRPFVIKPFIWSEEPIKGKTSISEPCVWILRSNIIKDKDCSYILLGLYKTVVTLDQKGKVVDYLKHVPGIIPNYFVFLRISKATGIIEYFPIE